MQRQVTFKGYNDESGEDEGSFQADVVEIADDLLLFKLSKKSRTRTDPCSCWEAEVVKLE